MINATLYGNGKYRKSLELAPHIEIEDVFKPILQYRSSKDGDLIAVLTSGSWQTHIHT